MDTWNNQEGKFSMIERHKEIKCPHCGEIIDLHEVEIQNRLEWKDLMNADIYLNGNKLRRLDKNEAVIF